MQSVFHCAYALTTHNLFDYIHKLKRHQNGFMQTLFDLGIPLELTGIIGEKYDPLGCNALSWILDTVSVPTAQVLLTTQAKSIVMIEQPFISYLHVSRFNSSYTAPRIVRLHLGTGLLDYDPVPCRIILNN